MDKAPDAYRTISEVGEDLDLPQHVLRFWETRFAQIKPLKRGGGRRYYRPDDVELLKGIRHLLYKEGYTIKGVQRILKEQGARAVMAWARPVEEMEAFGTPIQPYFAPQPEFAAQTPDPPPLALAPAVAAPAPQPYAAAPAAPVMVAPAPQPYAAAPAAPVMAAPAPQPYAAAPAAPVMAAPAPQTYAAAPAAPVMAAPAPQIYAAAPAAPVMAAPAPQTYAAAPAAPVMAAPAPQTYVAPPEVPPPWQEAQPEDPMPSPAAKREIEPSPPMAIATGQVSMFRGGLRRLEGQQAAEALQAPTPTPRQGASRGDPAPPAVQQAAHSAASAGERGRAQLIEALQALNETRAVLDQLLALRCDPLP